MNLLGQWEHWWCPACAYHNRPHDEGYCNRCHAEGRDDSVVEQLVPAEQLRGAVSRIAALERERDELAQRLRQASRNAEAAEAEVERLTGGQYEQPATKDTTAVEALKRIRDHTNSADDPAMIAQQALNQLGER